MAVEGPDQFGMLSVLTKLRQELPVPGRQRTYLDGVHGSEG